MRKPQLFLLHFAGGNCYSFRAIEALLNDFETIPLELPGRGKRVKEKLLTDFDLAAEDLYRQLVARLHTGPFLIYGHSMGAYLALRVANMLEKTGKYPVCLVVSGNSGPHDRPTKKRYLLQGTDFIKALEELGGISQEFIENEELFSYFEPILRADFEIAERNGMMGEPPVNASLYAVMGSLEERAHEIANWGKYTRGDFNTEVLEGDHFFINNHPEKMARIIRSAYNSVASLKNQ